MLRRYGIISLGCLFYAVGFAFFIEPAELAPGGVSGLAVLIHHYLPVLDSGLLILSLNVPLLVAGAVILGKKFLYGTVWATILSSVLISVLDRFANVALVRWLLVNGIIGGIFLGVGLGLVFRKDATTGGTDIVVRLIRRRWKKLSSGNIFLLIDCIIVLLSGLLFRDLNVMVNSAISLLVSMLVFQKVYREAAE